jgi:hypothetical protein
MRIRTVPFVGVVVVLQRVAEATELRPPSDPKDSRAGQPDSKSSQPGHPDSKASQESHAGSLGLQDKARPSQAGCSRLLADRADCSILLAAPVGPFWLDALDGKRDQD